MKAFASLVERKVGDVCAKRGPCALDFVRLIVADEVVD